MKKFVVGIVDSVDIIHNMFDTYIDFYNNKCDPKIEIKHFYKPKEAAKFIV